MKAKHSVPILLLLVLLALLVAAPCAIRSLNEGRDLPVLMYHGFADDPGNDVWTVSTAEFERQVREMKEDGRTTLLPNQIALAARGLYLLPKKPVVITMDDGFQDNVTIAEPILRKYGMKGICYLIISHIADTAETRSQYRERNNLVWPEVRESLSRGSLFFGSHSVRHQPIAKSQAKEVKSSRHIFHKKTGKKTNAYCYPNGYAPDLVWKALQYRHRYTTAMACGDTLFRFSCKADLYRIPRVSVYGGNHAFSISSVGWDGDRLSATVSNAGLGMPVRVLLREKGTSRGLLSNGAPIRLGQGKTGDFHWDHLPPDFKSKTWEVIVAEQNGLFTYGDPVDVPVSTP